MNLSEISNDLDALENEINQAEKELATATAQRDLLQKQGAQYGVKDTKEAKAKIAEYKSKLEKNGKEIVAGYESLKSEYEWN